MTFKAKRKGTRIENLIVKMHEKLGIGVRVRRVPLSGAIPGWPGDVQINLFDGELPLVGEVKARKGGIGWKVISRWLGTKDILFLKEDYKDPLVVLPWNIYVDIITRARENQ